ncbi:MAG: LPS-assembly protein LptD [Burkholderiales bacterium]
MHRRTLIAVAVASVFSASLASPARAQAQGLRLQPSLTPLPKSAQDDAPVHVRGDRIEARGDDEVEVRGDARLDKGDLSLSADRLLFFPEVEEVEAIGNVRLSTQGNEATGPRLRFRVNDQVGIFERPSFRLAPRRAPTRGNAGATAITTAGPDTATAIAPLVETRGSASAVRFEGDERYRITDGSFTSCKPGVDDWFLRAGEIDLDFASGDGEARNAALTFKGFTTPRLPWIAFSLSNERKSGLLPPTFAFQGKVGPELTVPFYWNIAPNYDATIAPRFMAKRGLQLLNEFRYLEPSNQGTARYEYLAHDRQLGINRYGFAWQHQAVFPGIGNGQLNINKVSDDNYFRDLSGRLTLATQIYLPREGQFNYNVAPGWVASARIQRFQTLQDAANPVAIQYERVPQLTLNGFLPNQRGGTDVNFAGEFVAFDHPTLPLGRRLTAYPSVARPFVYPGFFVTPKVGVHMTQYSVSRFDAAADPFVLSRADSSPSRTLPIMSLDSGLFFERNVNLQGRPLVNTLEPRAYYLYVPYRNQSGIPLFDTGAADFNYAQIFSENYYSGGDRISDANQLTLALTSRLITSDSGQEVIRGILAQRFYFQSQRVPLTSTTTTRDDRLSSILIGVAGRVAPKITLETTAQIASATRAPERLNAALRYQPELGKIVNLGYRYTSPNLPNNNGAEIRQWEVSGQWPLSGRWYLVGRYNYSIVNRQSVESLVGLEYNAGCWILRTVVQQFATATGTQTKLFFLQLELDGFSRIGSNPLEVLRRNVPGYTVLNRPSQNARGFDFYGD